MRLWRHVRDNWFTSTQFWPGDFRIYLILLSGKTRTKDKYRIVYSEYQKVELEKEYHFSKYITIQRKTELARHIALSERQVKIWFQNRRAKERKLKRKDEKNVNVSTSSDMKDSSDGDHIKMEPSQDYVMASQPSLPHAM